MAAHDSRNPAGVLRSLLHPPSTEADRVKAIKDRGSPEGSRTCRIMIVESRSMNVQSRDAAMLHAVGLCRGM